ncbi:AAA domain-containing protein [Copromyces sp. CBS 386.78]|nr:AAA domain-containing protein [Copromyces sp. CBS 386.78]
MSKIEKMSILGVRSFGPRHPEAIAFNTPLTLIVGYNGSGKTTIIECLKYATTGELPPNSKGGAFIHDPNLVGEKDVQAQIKLSFRSTVGESFVVTRNVQVVVKKATRTQKALEGSLLLRSNGDRQVISTRVMELDKLVPEKLGVSSAVLDAVIFCHQDESLWPMSAPADLKKKFDEIFEAQKYAKVIENLKVLRKNKGEELRLLKMQEAQDKQNKERADKVDKELNKITREIQEARDKCSELQGQIEEEDIRIKQKWEQANSFLRIVNELQTKHEKLEYKKDAIAELGERIEESTESDEYLRDSLNQYEQTVDRMNSDRDQKVAQFGTLQTELKTARVKHTAKAEEQGKHQSDKDKYDRQLVSQRQMIQEGAEKHEIRGFTGDLDDQEIKAFYERIEKMLQDTKQDLERLHRDNAVELDAKSATITELESRKASRIRDRKTSSQRVATLQRDITKLQGELNNLDVDEGAEAVLRTEMKGLESKTKEAKADIKVAGLDAQIRELNNEVLTLEAQGAKLSRELVECTNLVSQRAQLELRKKQLRERKGELDILKSTFNQQLTEVIGKDWTPATIESDFQKALRRLGDRVSELRKAKDSTQQELKQVEFKLTTARDKQTKSMKERDNCKKDVVDALNKVKRLPDTIPDIVTVDHYTEAVEWTETELKDIDENLKLAGGWTKYFTRAKLRAEKKHICILCERSVDGDDEARDKLMENIMAKLNLDNKDKILEAQAETSRDLGTLRSVRAKYETYGRLCKELPSMAEEITSLTSQKEKLVRLLEDQDDTFKVAEEKRNSADILNKSVLKIAQTVKDIADSEKQIERSQQNSSIQVRSADEINDDQTVCAEQLRVAQAKLIKLTAERQRLKDQAAQLEVEKLELKHRITEVVQQLEHKKRLQDTIKNHKEEQNELRKNMQDIDKEVEGIDPEIASARAALEESRKQGRAKEQRIAEERDGIATTVSELKMINREIQDYLDRGGPANLASNKRAIASLESTIATLERDMKELTIQINKLNKEIDNSDAKRRNIADNLTYRKNQRERDALEEEIEELESRNAQEDYDRLVKEAHYLESRRGKLNADRERLMGSMSTKDEQFARLNDEYEIELKGARARYKESHIKVETTKAAIEDLARGTMALDQAIMQYHSLKMEEINRTIGELWQSTYQGTDIDTIHIRSDMDSSASGASNTRRTYNYRVSMIKGDTEMDMRGRCSAGQKVLACIIIRLALAESFGVNCGLIALDEPTTNLDSDNIRSLAESLHAIIKARRSQNNLQLVVITHDEEFLKHMQCSEFCDDFFRVKRDENQNSVISRESITRISE